MYGNNVVKIDKIKTHLNPLLQVLSSSSLFQILNSDWSEWDRHQQKTVEMLLLYLIILINTTSWVYTDSTPTSNDTHNYVLVNAHLNTTSDIITLTSYQLCSAVILCFGNQSDP
jgi:hypothetical protein